MKTNVDRKNGHAILGFSIRNTFVSVKKIATVLSSVEHVSDIEIVSGSFGKNETRITFKLKDRRILMIEPFGDSSEFCFVFEDRGELSGDMSDIETAISNMNESRFLMLLLFGIFILISYQLINSFF